MLSLSGVEQAAGNNSLHIDHVGDWPAPPWRSLELCGGDQHPSTEYRQCLKRSATVRGSLTLRSTV